MDIETLLAITRAVLAALEQVQAAKEGNGNADASAGRPADTAAAAGAPVGAAAASPAPVTSGPTLLGAVPSAGETPKRRGRPPGSGKAQQQAAPPTSEQVQQICSDKLKELAGKLDGDEDAARKMVKEAVKGASGVERLKEVPTEKLSAVRDAVQALDAPEGGNGDGDEGEEF